MMKGKLYNLAKSLGISILAFREHRGKTGFYAPNISKDSFDNEVKIEKEGIFTNIYPEDEWYLSLIEKFSEIEIPDFEKPLKRSESVKRTLLVCSDYVKEKTEIPEISESFGHDGIIYNSKEPKEKITEEREYDSDDAAFYLYSAYKKAEAMAGDRLSLTNEAKKLLVSMAFLEADVERCVKRKDTSVLYKRARKCAEYYFEYYNEGDIVKKDKGKVSLAYLKFSSIIFYLFGSNALQDDKFIV